VTVAPPPPPLRRVPRAALAAWRKPGLCTAAGEASALRLTLGERFRSSDPDASAWTVHWDPRILAEGEPAVLSALEQAERWISGQLGVRTPRPEVFVYADRALMKASACINEDVVAFYDGALHLVAGSAELQQSVTHEYSHHALFGAGLFAPAWAQEGLAMQLADERWWREPQRLAALVDRPFSLTDMERVIPYKLPGAQAVAYYVQAAAQVQCLLLARRWQPRDLLAALLAGTAADALAYDLPELQQPRFLADCARERLLAPLQ
jgi:hypothetical protein